MKFEIAGAQCSLGVFADDIGVSCARFFEAFPILIAEFGLVRSAAGLVINTNKTYIILYNNMSIDQVKARIKACGIVADDFVVVDAARYLGLFLGVDNGNVSWRHPLTELRKRFAHIKSLKMGLTPSISAHNMIGFSTLMFVGQFLPPPPEAFRILKEGFSP